MIGTQPYGDHGTLDDPSLEEFWSTASDCGAVVYVHPMIPCGDDRVLDIGTLNAVGRISDSIVALGRLVLSGHLLKYQGVKCIASHGGGALPLIAGRLARAAEINEKWSDPYASLRRLYADSIVFDSRALEFTAQLLGASRVMMGSDAPFPIGDLHPSRIIERARLSQSEKLMILDSNARALFIRT